MQLLLKAGNKLGPSIRNDHLWNTVQTQDASNVFLRVLLYCEAGVHGYKVDRLGESIDNRPYRINLVCSRR
jgi:hypothetical protein